MGRHIKRSWMTVAFFGGALALIALGVAPVFEAMSLRLVLISAGLVGLAARLVTLQLAYFREGDRKWSRATRSPAPLTTQAAPAELRNPRYRAVWEHLNGVRQVMARRQAAALDQERIDLDLPEDERILFMGDRRPIGFWPVVALSLAAITVSSFVSDTAVDWGAFFLLGAGLIGLLFLAATRDRTRFYLTDYRILIRSRTPLIGGTRWTALYYPDVEHLTSRSRFGRAQIRVVGDGRIAELAGLNRGQLDIARAILRDRVAPEASATDY